jgi:hypothetical protein
MRDNSARAWQACACTARHALNERLSTNLHATIKSDAAWPRPWIEAVNLCTRLSSRRSLGSPWLARHPTTTATVMGANHFKWSVLVANSPSPMCGSSLIPPLVLSLDTSTLSFWGSWIQSWSVLGGSVFWWELLVPVLLKTWENRPGFSFQNYFRFILINQGILFSLNFDQAHSQIRRFS